MISNVRGVRAVKSAVTRRTTCCDTGCFWMGLPASLLAESPAESLAESLAVLSVTATVPEIEVFGWERGVTLEIWAVTTSESSSESSF